MPKPAHPFPLRIAMRAADIALVLAAARRPPPCAICGGHTITASTGYRCLDCGAAHQERKPS